MTGTTARAHTEERHRRLEECLAEEEETKFRSEAAKLRVDGWLAGRGESAQKPTRGGDTESHSPSEAASSSAPAVASSSSAAADQYQGGAVPDHGVKRVCWSPQVQDTRELDPNESTVQPQGLTRQPESTTEELEDGDPGDADADMKMLGAVCEELGDNDRA